MSRASISQYRSSVRDTNTFIGTPFANASITLISIPQPCGRQSTRCSFSTMPPALVRRYLLQAQRPSSVLQIRTLHASAISCARTRAATDNDHSFDLDDVDEDDERHTTSFGWEMIRQQKQFHDYMRAIERDAPVLRSQLIFFRT